MKFTKNDDGYGIKEIQKQLRLSRSNNETLKSLTKIYACSAADIVNEFLHIETKKLENLEKIKKFLEEKKVCTVSNRELKFIGYFPESEKDLIGNPLLNEWGNPIIKNKFGYEKINITIRNSSIKDYNFIVEYYKNISIYNNITENPLYTSYYTMNYNLKNEKELLNLLEELNFDIYNILIE